jgi:Flp pilus assembly protein TadB
VSYCPKCGNTVDETMTFCPRCGASLKMETTQPSSTRVNYARSRNEKQEKQEKGEKHEKSQHRFVGWLIAGVCLVILGVVAYTDSVYHWVPTGPEAGAFGLVVFGVVVLVVAVYFWTRSKRRFPATA